MMTIVLHDTDHEAVAQGLNERVQQAPSFFKKTPVIVDFSNVRVDVEYDFNALFKAIRQRQLLPVAVRGLAPGLAQLLQEAGVPIVEQAATAGANRSRSGLLRGKAGKTLFVSEEVGEGQQCFAQSGDLVLLADAPVSAELIADGNIHVYGSLRCRAMCGAHGNTEARIFCSALETVLVSVAGHSCALQAVPDELKNRPVQIRLIDNKVVIEPATSG